MWIICTLIIIFIVSKSVDKSEYLYAGLIAFVSLFMLNSEATNEGIIFLVIYWSISYVVSVICLKFVNKFEMESIERVFSFVVAYNLIYMLLGSLIG